LPDDIPDDWLTRVANGEKVGALWLVVRYSYTDALKSCGDSPYCWMYNPHTRRFMEFPLPWFPPVS